MSVDGTETTISQTFSDYRRFGGVLFPCMIEGATQRLRTTQIEVNVAVEDSVFAPR